MTIGELKELLSQYPDYYPVTIRLVDDGLMPDCVEIVKTSTYKGYVLIEPEAALDIFDPHEHLLGSVENIAE